MICYELEQRRSRHIAYANPMNQKKQHKLNNELPNTVSYINDAIMHTKYQMCNQRIKN